jgi:hypothetical protein
MSSVHLYFLLLRLIWTVSILGRLFGDGEAAWTVDENGKRRERDLRRGLRDTP